MYGAHALRARHYVIKPERIEGSTINTTSNGNTSSPSSNHINHIQKSSTKINPIQQNQNHTNKDNSNSNPSTKTMTNSIQPTPISIASVSATNTTISNPNSSSPPSPIKRKTSNKSPTSPKPKKSRKHHKKKHKKNNHNKHSNVFAPILIFPYKWNGKEAKCENNKQFHKKSKSIAPRITLQHGIDHLLSPSKCSKRYLSAYMLNLHQLTKSEYLLESIIKKCTPVIKQLHHINNELNAKQQQQQKQKQQQRDRTTSNLSTASSISTNSEITTYSNGVCSPSEDPSFFSKFSQISGSHSTPPSPLQSPYVSPANTASLPPNAPLMQGLQLSVINDENEVNNTAKLNPHSISESVANKLIADNKKLACSQPTHHHPSIPVSNLDLVETRSCPDLDDTYNNMSDDIDNTTPPLNSNNSLLAASRSHPLLIPKSNSYHGNDINNDKPEIQVMHRRKDGNNNHTQNRPTSMHSSQPSNDSVEDESCIKPSTASKRRGSLVKQVHNEEDGQCISSTPNICYKTKMKAYCVATVKHNIDILYHWIYYYPQDFAEPKLLESLLTYIAKVKDKTPTHNSIIRRWQKLLQLIQHRKPEMKQQSILSSSISNLRIAPKVREHGRKTSFQFTDSFFPPRQMVQKLGGGIDLLKIHPALVADQLTLIDTEIFLQIKPREFTNQSWQNRPNLSSTELLNDGDTDDDKTKNAEIYDKLNRQKIESPNLLYMIDHVNRLSLWVATEILSRNTTAEMADLTKYFYVVAHRCLELCNIHTCTAIFGGICLQPLTRLRRLNRYLSDDEQIQTLHRALSEIVSSNHNYKTYRAFIEQWYSQQDIVPRPCIPFIPVVMKDLFQIQLHLIQRMKPQTKNNDDKQGQDEGDEESKEEVEELKHIDLGLLEKNCRHIRRVYESQQKAKLYANQLPADTDIQSKLRMNIAKFETHETLSEWSFEIQPKLTKEDKENLEMIDTLEEFGFL